MKNKRVIVSVGDVFKSNSCGDFVVIEINNPKDATIKFLKTSNTVKTNLPNIRTGKIKDALYPTVCGIACFGIGPYKSRVNGVTAPSYRKWLNMINRCYGKTKKKAYDGVTVCDEWLNYQNFVEWYNKNNVNGMHLDKDIIFDGNKVYGPSSCKMVTAQENSEKAQAKEYKFKSPSGEIVTIYNLAKFCVDNDLMDSHMSHVYFGARGSHKGWRRAQ